MPSHSKSATGNLAHEGWARAGARQPGRWAEHSGATHRAARVANPKWKGCKRTLRSAFQNGQQAQTTFESASMDMSQIKTLIAERDYILMFMEEVEQTTTFWLWHRYVSKHHQEEAEWDHPFRLFMISAFHSSLLSVRKLNDFFTAGGREDDIKASRYDFNNMTSPLNETAQGKLNKYLAHMTVPGADLRSKDWDIDDFTRPIYLRAFEFCDHLGKNFLSPATDAELLQKLSSFKRGLLFHIRRVGASVDRTEP